MDNSFFDPNDIGIDNGCFFALPVEVRDSEIVVVSVPWDATVSYNKGTSAGPQAILNASTQVDLFDVNVPNAWDVKLGTEPMPEDIARQNRITRIWAEKVINSLEHGKSKSSLTGLTRKVNDGSMKMNRYVYDTASRYLKENKVVAVVGGEHSVPLGLVKALGEKYDTFGVLHIDAHADLREAYEGFTYSHASIMYNILKEVPQVRQLTQVAVRDFCSQEQELISTDGRIKSFTDFQIHRDIFEGKPWGRICDEIIATLPENVYISFDIDGLTPEYCPGTGTPVPGGITFSQADYLLYRLSISEKHIIGFDLCEVSPSEGSEWDANVGARVLFKLSLYLHHNMNLQK